MEKEKMKKLLQGMGIATLAASIGLLSSCKSSGEKTSCGQGSCETAVESTSSCGKSSCS